MNRQYPVAQEARHLRQRGLFIGTDAKDRLPLYLAPKWLQTHLHIMGPTGTGKSRLLLWIFQLLCRTGRPIVLIDPKGSLYRMARDWALSSGLTKRLVLFDLAGDALPGYNPLRENGLRIDLQAQWVREGVKSAWGASTFDATPLLARMLYLCLYVARAMRLSLMDALDVLRPTPTLRHAALKRIRDPFVHGALLAFDALSDRLKAEQAQSTVSRLEMFLCDEIVRQVLCSAHSIDLEALLGERKILLANFAKYQPLLPDTLKLLGRMFFNDLLAHIYKGNGEGIFNEHRPCYVICDEVQNFATRQLCDALDEGRGIGLHCILAHQHLSQLADEDQSGYLLHSVQTDARTKVIFGGLSFADLETVSRDLFLDRYSPWALKDEIHAPVFAPVETTRKSRSISRSKSHGRALALPESTSDAVAHTTSHNRTKSTTASSERRRSVARTKGEAHGMTTSRAESLTAAEHWAETDAATEQWADSVTDVDQWSSAHGEQSSRNASLTYDYPVSGGIPALLPTAMHRATGENFGISSLDTVGGSSAVTHMTGGSITHARTHGGSLARGSTSGSAESHTSNEAETVGEMTGEGHALQHGTSEGETSSTGQTLTRGRTPSVSEEESVSVSETTVPFHEYEERDIVSSRTYLTPEEQNLMRMQQLQALPPAHFLLKTPGSTARIVRAPWVAEPRITDAQRRAKLERVYALPYYTRLALPATSQEPALLPPAQEDDEPQLWQPIE